MILGKPVVRPAELDLQLAEEIYVCGEDCDFQPVLGGTFCTDDFYEGLMTFILYMSSSDFF